MTKEKLLEKIKEYEAERQRLLVGVSEYTGAIQHCYWEIRELEKEAVKSEPEIKTEN